jgi:hypothetical protein
MPKFEITYAESVRGRLSETIEADQFDDAGPFIDFLGSRGGTSPLVRQVLRVRAEHVDRIELLDGANQQ